MLTALLLSLFLTLLVEIQQMSSAAVETNMLNPADSGRNHDFPGRPKEPSFNKMDIQNELQDYFERISADLDRTVDFWLNHSHDEQYGGFFNCLTEDGQVFDDTKYVWLQGRQVWTYCQLAKNAYVTRHDHHQTDASAPGRKQRLIDAAIRGGEFLMAHAKDPSSDKCYFSLTRDGKPIKIQRTMFSESFYAIAMVALAEATGEEKYKNEAKMMMDRILHWVRVDSSGTKAVVLEGTPKVSGLAQPMILLNLISEFEPVFGKEMYSEHASWAISQLFKHVQRNGSCVLENITPDGQEIVGSAIGRHQNPGHAIEGAWFLMDWAKKSGDASLTPKAIDAFLKKPFESGWDAKHGGILYFLDADGYSPLPLEWNMKLWWPHAEAMIAFLMAFEETGSQEHWMNFKKVADYVYTHFVDEKHGEWYGYLDRYGTKTHTHKGMPFKGCFHVPRALLKCHEILDHLIHKKGEA